MSVKRKDFLTTRALDQEKKQGNYPNSLGNPREEREKLTTVHGGLVRSAEGKGSQGESSGGRRRWQTAAPCGEDEWQWKGGVGRGEKKELTTSPHDSRG
jgi:hypothetical protein